MENLIWYIEKKYNEFKLHNIKQSAEEILIEIAVRNTIQRLYDKVFFDNSDNSDDILEEYLPIEVTERRTPILYPKHGEDNLIQVFCFRLNFECKATSSKKIQSILSSLSWNDAGIYWKDGPF